MLNKFFLLFPSIFILHFFDLSCMHFDSIKYKSLALFLGSTNKTNILIHKKNFTSGSSVKILSLNPLIYTLTDKDKTEDIVGVYKDEMLLGEFKETHVDKEIFFVKKYDKHGEMIPCLVVIRADSNPGKKISIYSLSGDLLKKFTTKRPIFHFAVMADQEKNICLVAAHRNYLSIWTLDGAQVAEITYNSPILAVDTCQYENEPSYIITTHYDRSLIIRDQFCRTLEQSNNKTFTIIGASNNNFYAFNNELGSHNFENGQLSLIHQHRKLHHPKIIFSPHHPLIIIQGSDHTNQNESQKILIYDCDGKLKGIIAPADNWRIVHTCCLEEDLFIVTECWNITSIYSCSLSVFLNNND